MNAVLKTFILTVAFALLAEGSLDPCSVCVCGQDTINCQSKGLNKNSEILKNGLNVSTIDFSFNVIKELLPFGSFITNNVSFMHNEVISIKPGAFNYYVGLKKLDLSHNHIPSIMEGTFDKILTIEELDLSFNSLSSLRNVFKGYLPNLKVLNLGDNPLNNLDRETMQTLGEFKELEVLSLSGTRIKALESLPQINLPKLIKLDLSSNYFNHIPKNYPNQNNLKYLNLKGNKLISRISQESLNLPNLEELNLSELSNLWHTDAKCFGQLLNLKVLIMEKNNKLKKIDPDIFEPIEEENFKLKVLNLRDNKLMYLPEEILPGRSGWKNLEILDIRGNNWACDCHSYWLVNDLHRQIEDKTPDLAKDLQCRYPTRIHMTYVAMACDDRDNFNPYRDDFGLIRLKHTTYYTKSNSALRISAILLLAISLAFVLIGIILFKKKKIADQLYRVVHKNKYTRAHEEEEEDPGDSMSIIYKN